MVSWPFELTGEILVDGAWVPVRMRQDPVVTVARGINAEGAQVQPGVCEVAIDNRDFVYSPRNPESPLYGKINRNTRFRLRVDELPEPGAVLLADDFDRTVANGWGTSSSGDDWVIYDPFGTSPPASAFSVDAGTGRLRLDVLGQSRSIRNEDVTEDDFDATFTVFTEERAQGDYTEQVVFAFFGARLDPIAHSWYEFAVGFRVDTGVPDGQGLRVTAGINRMDDPTTVVIKQLQTPVPGLTYQENVPVRVRAQGIGPELRMKIWADGDPEPAGWHAQAWDDAYTSGEFFFRSGETGPSTPLPFEVHVGDLEVLEPTADTGVQRFQGEIPAWPPMGRDLSGNELTVGIEASGILRRLGVGDSVLKSTMRRHIPPLFPLAYWPMEEGQQGGELSASAVLAGTTDALIVSGMLFAEDSDLLGSDPLPVLTDSAKMRSLPVDGIDTGSWSVHMMFRISEQDFPTDASEHTMLRFFTVADSAYEWVVVLLLDSGDHRMRLRIFDRDRTLVTSVSTTHEASLAGGGPGFLNDWTRLRVQAIQDGADVDFRFDWISLDGEEWGNGSTISSDTASRFYRIETTFGTQLDGMAIGHVSAWGVQFTTAYFHAGVEDAGLGGEASTTGLRGQRVRNFISRLSASEGIPVEIAGEGEMRLGPYPPGSFLGILTQATETDMGLLAEQRDVLELMYTAHEGLYNRPVALVLDYESGEIFPPFTPTDDDKNVANRVTASRREGSEYTAELSTGALSVQDPPDGIGVYDDSAETIVDSDLQLPDQAGWRLHLGTTDEMRLPQLTLMMSNPRMETLIDTVLAVEIGDRIQVENLPDDLSPDGFDLLVLGYREELADGRWDITFNCAPAGPWTVGVVGDAVLGRADTEASELGGAVSSTDTTLYVLTTSGVLWTTDGGEYPFDLVVGGERVTATAAAAAGGSSMVAAGTGTTTASTSHVAPSVSAPGSADLLVCAWIPWDNAANAYTVPGSMTELSQTPGTFARLTDAYEVLSGSGATGTRTATRVSSDAWAAVSVVVSGAPNNTPVIEEHLAGTTTTPTALTLTTAGTTEVGWWLLAIQGWDENGAAEDGGPDGEGWELLVTSGLQDANAPYLTVYAKRVTVAGAQAVTWQAGSATDNQGTVSVLSGVTDLTGQAFTVVRSVNGVEKAHVVGTDVRLFQPSVAAL